MATQAPSALQVGRLPSFGSSFVGQPLLSYVASQPSVPHLRPNHSHSPLPKHHALGAHTHATTTSMAVCNKADSRRHSNRRGPPRWHPPHQADGRLLPVPAVATQQGPDATHTPEDGAMPESCVITPQRVLLPPSPLVRVKCTDLQLEEGVVGAVRRTVQAAGTACDLPAASIGELCEGEDPETCPFGYLKKILTSRVYDVAVETPLEDARKLSERVGTKVLLKREDAQKVFSFKLRGAYNMMAQLPRAVLDRGVICSSAGNHAQGVALSAAQLHCEAIIAMPVTTPAIKWQSVKRLGATVVLVGDSYDETQAYAKERAAAEGIVFVPPFDHPDVIAGQGTIGMEIVRQCPGPLHAVFVPVGGGGLIAGIAAYMKQIRPGVKIIGVEPADANAMALSLHEGKRVVLDQVGGFADGVAVKMVGEETFRICQELVDGVVLVSRDAICAAIKDVFEETRSILEPAGALAVAGAKAYCKLNRVPDGEPVVAITSGANMNFDRLRLVAELAGVGERREAVLATSIPEHPGSFKQFMELLGPLNITEFKYRRAGEVNAHVLYSIGYTGVDELEAVQQRLVDAGLPTLDLSKNDLAKLHLRHLVGGKQSVPNEVLYRFEFPERPGALLKFLDTISPRWNITLFHYRATGEALGSVLVGLQVLPEDEDEFHAAADALGFDYFDERENITFKMFAG